MCQKDPTTTTPNSIATEVSCVRFDFFGFFFVFRAFSLLFFGYLYDVESQLVIRQSKIEICVLKRLENI